MEHGCKLPLLFLKAFEIHEPFGRYSRPSCYVVFWVRTCLVVRSLLEASSPLCRHQAGSRMQHETSSILFPHRILGSARKDWMLMQI